MNRADLKRLQSVRGYPALSILVPMHRTSPDNRQDPIRVKNLVKQGADRLQQEFSKREVEGLLANLGRLVSEVDYRHVLDGLALFVSNGFAQALHLPFPVKERIVVDATFATRDLVAGLNRNARYWVLVLSEKTTRLYGGIGSTLSEYSRPPFPMSEATLSRREHGHGDFIAEKSGKEDERHRRFLRQVDAALAALLGQEHFPVFVLGGQRPLALFHEITKQDHQFAGAIAGAYDKTPPQELVKVVGPLVAAQEAERRGKALKELEAAVRERKFVAGIQEVWPAAHEGRGSLLLVEEGFFYPARLDGSAQELAPAADPTSPGTIDDAVDEVVEAVAVKGGRVVFLTDGALGEYDRVALALRY